MLSLALVQASARAFRGADHEEIPKPILTDATISERAHLLDANFSDQNQTTINDSRQYSGSFNTTKSKAVSLADTGNVSLNVGSGASLVEKGLLAAIVVVLAFLALVTLKK